MARPGLRGNRVSAYAPLIGAALVALPYAAHAQALALPDLGGLIPSNFKTLDSALGVVWNSVVGVAGVTFMGYLLYGGFLYLTSGGDDSIAQRARHTLRDASIGIVLVILAWPIGIFVLSILGAQGIIGASKTPTPSATGTTPLNPAQGSSGDTSGGTATTPTGTVQTSTTNNPQGTPVQVPVQTTTAKAKAAPNSTFKYVPGTGADQTVTTDNQGETENLTLDPAYTYAPTDIVILSRGNSGVGTVVPGATVHVWRKAALGEELLYGNVTLDSTGHAVLRLPVGEQIRIVDANSGAELYNMIQDDKVRAGLGNQIQGFEPTRQ